MLFFGKLSLISMEYLISYAAPTELRNVTQHLL
jgi:hypothetical protein